MNRVSLIAGVFLIGLLPPPATAADEHVVVSPDSLNWGAAPPAFPKGAQIAVLSGDPSKEGLYVVRLKVPAGYKIPAHVHPNDEHVTVISGTFNIGMGDKLDEKKGNAVKAGGFARAPKDMQHYAWFTEDTIVQLHGMGPQGITYVNPADDPRKSNQNLNKGPAGIPAGSPSNASTAQHPLTKHTHLDAVTLTPDSAGVKRLSL